MKKYNKPVVEINGFEVEDVIAVSIWFSGDPDAEDRNRSILFYNASL